MSTACRCTVFALSRVHLRFKPTFEAIITHLVALGHMVEDERHQFGAQVEAILR